MRSIFDVFVADSATLANVGSAQFADRKVRKRDMRSLWINRINAASREHGLKYGDFIHGMNLANIELDRKALADLAVTEPEAFKNVCITSKEALMAKYAKNAAAEGQASASQ